MAFGSFWKDVGIFENIFFSMSQSRQHPSQRVAAVFGSDDEEVFKAFKKLELDFFTFSYYLEDIVPANVCYVLSTT